MFHGQVMSDVSEAVKQNQEEEEEEEREEEEEEELVRLTTSPSTRFGLQVLQLTVRETCKVRTYIIS